MNLYLGIDHVLQPGDVRRRRRRLRDDGLVEYRAWLMRARVCERPRRSAAFRKNGVANPWCSLVPIAWPQPGIVEAANTEIVDGIHIVLLW